MPIDKGTEKLGQGQDSVAYWEEQAQKYVNALVDEYHQHRLEVISRLIPRELFASGKTIVDFGCGDAVHVVSFLESGASAFGVDVSAEMIATAKRHIRNAGFDPALVAQGSAGWLERFDDESVDALISFNVLAYLTDEEELTFYQHATRIIRPGGYLIVTHSNELFDLFSLNRYTAEFISKHLLGNGSPDLVAGLLTASQLPEERTCYNVRENPLTYRHKLAGYGFDELQQEFANFHEAPPPVLKRAGYPRTLDWDERERWKLMFTCSTYGSISQKQ